jgi:hypothetical protein
MKTFTTVFLALVLTASLFASPHCDRLAMYDMENLRASFEQDLVSHVWRTGILGSTANLYFQENGLVTAIPASQDKVDTYTWALADNEGMITLSFYRSSGVKSFVVSPTCDGIATTIRGKAARMLISEEAYLSDTEQEFLLKQITGTWHYIPVKSEKIYQGPLTLTFASDGTFMMQSGPDTFHSDRDGVWHLSNDGNYLILYSRIESSEKTRLVPEVISIKSLDFEDMVIDAKHLPRTMQQYEGRDPLYMSKVRA